MNNFAAIFIGILAFVFAVIIADRLTGRVPLERKPEENQAIAERIRPLGEVRISPPATPALNVPIPLANPTPITAAEVVPPPANIPPEPPSPTMPLESKSAAKQCSENNRKIYITACFSCHETGAAGAPKRGDFSAWRERLQQGRDILAVHVLNGFKNMPERAGNPNLTEDEIQIALPCLIYTRNK